MNVVETRKPARRQPILAKGAGVRRNRSGEITRTKILDAAEQVFAAKGIQGSSLREIMIAAQVNIAAVNYYFGNKTNLLRAVVDRRLGHINEARLAMLAEARDQDGRVSLDAWLDALATPLMQAEGSDDPGWRNFVRVLVWLATMRDASSLQVIDDTYNALRERFVDTLRGALPDLSYEEINWRYQFVLGVLRTCVGARERAAARSNGSIDANDLERMMTHVRTFLLAALQAPPTERIASLN